MTSTATRREYLVTSATYVSLMLLGSVFEIGFTGLTARLPGSGYAIVNALFNIFFIATAPLTAVQLMIARETATLMSNGREGAVRPFLAVSFRTVTGVMLGVGCAGLLASPLIAGYLRLERTLPVMLLMGIITVYAMFPVWYGAVQGVKRFFRMGSLIFFWGLFRFIAAAVVIFLFAGGEVDLLIGVIVAVFVLACVAWLMARTCLPEGREPLKPGEFTRALASVLPIMVSLVLVMVLKNADIIFANRFFDAGAALAYTCAARVGSGIFALGSVSMVMFPHVAEEHARENGRPHLFLYRSLGFVGALSIAAMAGSWLWPGLVMRIITLGKVIPGAEPLIRLIGFVVLPLSLIFIMSNYLLARHRTGFLPLLGAGAILLAILVHVFHATPREFLVALAAANSITAAALFVLARRA